MSFPLPSVDLTSAVAGATGTISLNNVGISAGGVSNNPSLIKNPAYLYAHNESGCGLQIVFSQSGQGFNLPAGGWTTVALPPGENLLKYTVVYSLPNPQVSMLLLTYYAPGEDVPQTMTLGNSPIGGSTATAGNILSNEAATLGTKIIDIGLVGNTDMLDIFNDHFLWSVIQSGVAHQVLKGQTTGSPLQIGQAGDTTDLLGKLALTGKVTSIAGGVAGTATLYELLTGTIKLSVCRLATFQSGASIQNITFNVPYTANAYFWTTDVPGGTQVLSGGVAQNFIILTALATGGGTVAIQNNVNKDSQGSIASGFNQLSLPANNISTHTGILIFIGE